MSPSATPVSRRIRRSSSRLGGHNRPLKRSRMPAIRFALLVTAACGTMATGAYFAFSDDRLTRLIGQQTQTQISYDDQIADLRAQIDRISRLDQEQVEQQIKPLLQRQASLEQVTSGLAKDLAIQTRNSLPASGRIGTTPRRALLKRHPPQSLRPRMQSPQSKLSPRSKLIEQLSVTRSLTVGSMCV